MKNYHNDERAEAMRRGQDEIRREWDQNVATIRRITGAIGFPLICPERACGRTKRCVEPSRSLPPCWDHYPEEARYILNTMFSLWEQGVKPDPAAPKPARRVTLLEGLFGPDLSRLRRAKGAPASDGWNIDPEAFDRYLMAGDWREPFRAPPRTIEEWWSANKKTPWPRGTP